MSYNQPWDPATFDPKARNAVLNMNGQSKEKVEEVLKSLRGTYTLKLRCTCQIDKRALAYVIGNSLDLLDVNINCCPSIVLNDLKVRKLIVCGASLQVMRELGSAIYGMGVVNEFACTDNTPGLFDAFCEGVLAGPVEWNGNLHSLQMASPFENEDIFLAAMARLRNVLTLSLRTDSLHLSEITTVQNLGVDATNMVQVAQSVGPNVHTFRMLCACDTDSVLEALPASVINVDLFSTGDRTLNILERSQINKATVRGERNLDFEVFIRRRIARDRSAMFERDVAASGNFPGMDTLTFDSRTSLEGFLQDADVNQASIKTVILKYDGSNDDRVFAAIGKMHLPIHLVYTTSFANGATGRLCALLASGRVSTIDIELADVGQYTGFETLFELIAGLRVNYIQFDNQNANAVKSPLVNAIIIKISMNHLSINKMVGAKNTIEEIIVTDDEHNETADVFAGYTKLRKVMFGVSNKGEMQRMGDSLSKVDSLREIVFIENEAADYIDELLLNRNLRSLTIRTKRIAEILPKVMATHVEELYYSTGEYEQIGIFAALADPENLFLTKVVNLKNEFLTGQIQEILRPNLARAQAGTLLRLPDYFGSHRVDPSIANRVFRILQDPPQQ